MTAITKSLSFVLAVKPLDRMLGLLRRSLCTQGEVLVIAPCRSVHSFGMSEAISVAFVDRAGTVLKAVPKMTPRTVLGCMQASYVLERRCLPGNDQSPWFSQGDHICLTRFLDGVRK